MGMYTEIYVNVDLVEDTPQKVIDVLEAICCSNELPEGYPSRWEYLFSSGSYYTPNTCVSKLSFSTISKQYSLLGKGDIKDYNDEIVQFFEFIEPYVDKLGEKTFIGYYRYEESEEPVLVYARG